MKFKMEVSEVQFFPKAANAESLIKKLEPAMHDVIDRHRVNYDAGKGPDGSAQKRYSESYKKAIRAGRVRAKKGGVRKDSIKPNLQISGDMLKSQQVIKKKSSLEIKFIDSAQAQKASYLRRKGFKLSYFSRKDIKAISKLAQEALAGFVTKILKTKN